MLSSTFLYLITYHPSKLNLRPELDVEVNTTLFNPVSEKTYISKYPFNRSVLIPNILLRFGKRSYYLPGIYHESNPYFNSLYED